MSDSESVVGVNCVRCVEAFDNEEGVRCAGKNVPATCVDCAVCVDCEHEPDCPKGVIDASKAPRREIAVMFFNEWLLYFENVF